LGGLREKVPGAKARFVVALMSGLKPGPISEARAKPDLVSEARAKPDLVSEARAKPDLVSEARAKLDLSQKQGPSRT
jgi:hypothetical protein